MQKVCFKIIVVALLIFANNFNVNAQITSGRIVFERKTNLKKRFGNDPRLGQYITEENKYRIEKFELLFNDSMCLYQFIKPEVETEEGFLKFLTSRNTVNQNIKTNEKVVTMDLWGTTAYLKDSIHKRAWKITDSRRVISGYNCRKAIWEMDDSTRIYAWYSLEIVPSMGPEGFSGLPGTIMGMATEDGGVVYFAKEVKTMPIKPEIFNVDLKGKDVYTEVQLKELLMMRMKQWIKPKDLEAMFKWL